MYNKMPKNICYRLTRKCNLSCKFCFACKQIDDLNIDLIKKSVFYLKEEGMQCIRLTGGEPTVRKDLIEIIDFCLGLDLKVILYSNLYKIDDFFKDLIRLPIEITTSIHGKAEYHNYITGLNSYTKTYNNILRLLESGIKVNVHSVLTGENYLDSELLIKDMLEIGIKKVTFQTLIPRDRGAEMKLSYEEVEKIEFLISTYKAKYESEIQIKMINMYKKFYYVVEPDGYLYLQKENEENDEIIRRII